MCVDTLLDLLMSPDRDHRCQGVALLSAITPSIRKALYCELVCQSDWRTILTILSNEDRDELRRLQWMVRARVLLRVYEIYQRHDWLIPSGMVSLLENMLRASCQEQKELRMKVFVLEDTYRRERYWKISPYRILDNALRDKQSAQSTATSLQRHYVDLHYYDLFHKVVGTRSSMPLISELALARADTSVLVDWPIRWSALRNAPTAS